MPVSLAEYMRSVQQADPTLAGVIKTYTENAPILGDSYNLGLNLPALKWQSTVGGIVSFTRQKTLPTTAWRAIGSEFVASKGETEKITEDLKIGGGKVEIDRALINRGGENGAIEQQIMTVASFARNWNKAFYKGTGANDSITGLNSRLDAASKSIANGNAALDLYKLDKMLLEVKGTDQVLIMGRGAKARLSQAAKSSSNVNYDPGNYGVSPASYGGIPIMLAGDDVAENEILDFSEASDTTSIYVLSLGDQGVVGAETKPMEIFWPTGRQEVDSPFIVEWDNNFIIKNPRAAYRLAGITDEAIGETVS